VSSRARDQQEAGVRIVSELRPHPRAAEVPTLSEPDYRLLRDDIAARGLQTPLEVTAAGVLLDGRARLRAARELGHESVAVLVVEPEDEFEHIVRAALLRRHLDASQRAALALKLVPYAQLREAARERQRASLHPDTVVATLPAPAGPAAQGRTRELIAELASTSPRTVQDVITVYEHDPDLFEQVLRGERKANTAASQIRRELRDAQLDQAPPLPHGVFDLIYADPPWRLDGSPDSSRAIERHYPTMDLERIKALKIPAAENAVLFLWGVNSMTPQAIEVINAWRFEYVTNFAWVKDKIGLGQYNRTQHELLHLGRRGSYPPPDTDRRASSVIEKRRGRHSEKPEAAYELIERMYPPAHRLELFARGKPRPGWTIWGNQAQPASGKSK
jgi:N6-adenosine-specific RNA methylase IME4